MNRTQTTSFALTAAALVVSGCAKSAAMEPADATEQAKVKCLGINECKGQGACHTAEHSCAGQNACKGKGWLLVPESECKGRGGQVL